MSEFFLWFEIFQVYGERQRKHRPELFNHRPELFNHWRLLQNPEALRSSSPSSIPEQAPESLSFPICKIRRVD